MDIQEIANSLTYEEFMIEYNCFMICPHLFSLQDASTDISECNRIECDECWRNSLVNIKFKEN